MDEKNPEPDKPMADVGRPLPVMICDNIYLNGAGCRSHEKNACVMPDLKANIRIAQEGGHYYLYSDLGDILSEIVPADKVTTQVLRSAFESDQPFENRDGSPFSAESDFMDHQRNEKVKIGPCEDFVSKIKLV